MARFCDSGSMPDDSNALHIWHSTGTRTTAVLFTNHVETGSRSQNFGGIFLSNAIISSVVTAGTNPIHRGCEVFGKLIRRRRLSEDGSWWLQQCIHLRPQCSNVLFILCDGLDPVRLETELEYHSLMCKLLAPGRERLFCLTLRLLVDSLEVTRLDLF